MDVDTALFAADASRFVAAFMAPISHSAPHTYLSALPFAPAQSLVSNKLLGTFSKTLSVVVGKVDTWPAILNVFEGHTSGVTSVAFSGDGKQVVSGSWDYTVQVWDAQTGDLVAGPF